MKKKIIMIITLLLLFISPNIVKADEGFSGKSDRFEHHYFTGSDGKTGNAIACRYYNAKKDESIVLVCTYKEKENKMKKCKVTAQKILNKEQVESTMLKYNKNSTWCPESVYLDLDGDDPDGVYFGKNSTTTKLLKKLVMKIMQKFLIIGAIL